MRLLVDVSGLVHRAAYKMGHLTDAAGRNTGAAFGTMKSLGMLAETYEPEEIVICWDAGHTKRSALYPAYKANRKRDPELTADLAVQQDMLRETLRHLPVVQVREPGCEGDDLIAALSGFLRLEEVGIVTSDHDLYCLAGPRCMIIGLDGTPARLDLEPAQYLTYKVIVGDTSDNIKGVLGIGDVKARRLIAEHDTLEGILDYAMGQGGLGGMNWDEVRRTCKRNVTLMTPGGVLEPEQRRSIIWQYTHSRLERRIDRKAFRQALMEMGFLSIVSRLEGWLQPFRHMERRHEAQAQAESTSTSDREGRAAGSDREGCGGREARIAIRVEDSYRQVRATEPGGVGAGERAAQDRGTAAQRAAAVLERLRAQAPAGLAAPGNERSAGRAVPDVHGQARARGAGARAAGVPADAGEVRPQRAGERALSVLQMLSCGDGWRWLRSRPSVELQRVVKLIERVVGEGKAVPFDDAEFLYGLEEAFGDDMPAWMRTEKELREHARRITRQARADRCRG